MTETFKASRRAPDRAILRGFLWGFAASGLVLVGFLALPLGEARQGRSSRAGEASASSGAAGSIAEGGTARPREAQVRAVLARDPNDVDARLALARLYLARRDMKGAWNETLRVLEKAPGHPQALAYQALVYQAIGRSDVALDLLKKALSSDPNLTDGYAYMALVCVRMGRLPEAEAVIADASQRFPRQGSEAAAATRGSPTVAGGDDRRPIDPTARCDEVSAPYRSANAGGRLLPVQVPKWCRPSTRRATLRNRGCPWRGMVTL